MNMNDLKVAEAPDASAAGAPVYPLWQLVLYMLRLGTLGFGGPVALVGYMYRDLVEQRGWISDADYKEGMALAQLMPGPRRRSWPSTWGMCISACGARRWSVWRSYCRRS